MESSKGRGARSWHDLPGHWDEVISSLNGIRELWKLSDPVLLDALASGYPPRHTSGFQVLVRDEGRWDLLRRYSRLRLDDGPIAEVLPLCDPALRDELLEMRDLLDPDGWMHDEDDGQIRRWRVTWGETGLDERLSRLLDKLVAAGQAELARTATKSKPAPSPSEEIRAGDIALPGVTPVEELYKATFEIVNQVDLLQENAATLADARFGPDPAAAAEAAKLIASQVPEWKRVVERWPKALQAAADFLRTHQIQTESRLRAFSTLKAVFSEPLIKRPGEKQGEYLTRRGGPLSSTSGEVQWPGETIDPARHELAALLQVLGPFCFFPLRTASGDSASTVDGRPGSEAGDQPGQAIQPPPTSSAPMSWENARNKAEAIVKREGFPRYLGKPSVNRLAKKVGCSPSTLQKAIAESSRLRRAQASEASAPADELSRLIAEQQLDDESRFA